MDIFFAYISGLYWRLDVDDANSGHAIPINPFVFVTLRFVFDLDAWIGRLIVQKKIAYELNIKVRCKYRFIFQFK